jgi:predicted glycoside hydrolase/deacetylase ChbG (UPF0249 family)
MQIYIHADDFGATKSVNHNINRAWQVGALNSLSVFANGEALQEGAAAINSKMDQKIRLAVHLNLT